MFEDNDIFLSIVTLTELTDLKSREGEVGYAARCVRNQLRKIRENNVIDGRIPDPKEGYALGNNLGKLYIIEETLDEEYDVLKKAKKILPKITNDVMIIGSAMWVKRQYPDMETILLTDDADMCFFADLLGLKNDSYRNKSVNHTYTGRRIIDTSDEIIDQFYKDRLLVPDPEWNLTVNEFVLVRGYTPQHSFIGCYNGKEIVALDNLEPYGVIPRNNGQKFMISAMMNKDIPLVIVEGAAGTAKTFLSLACGLEQTLEEKQYEQILITRANVEMDATYGYLPGDEQSKIGPMLRAFSDNLNHLTRDETIKTKDGRDCPSIAEWLEAQGIIRMEAMEYMRGRSLDNTYLIIDEAQNTTPHQAFSLISRIGENSKIILIGDPEQIDNKHLNRQNNGLVYSAEGFIGSKLCAQIRMEDRESTRSPLATEAIKRLSPKHI